MFELERDEDDGRLGRLAGGLLGDFLLTVVRLEDALVVEPQRVNRVAQRADFPLVVVVGRQQRREIVGGPERSARCECPCRRASSRAIRGCGRWSSRGDRCRLRRRGRGTIRCSGCRRGSAAGRRSSDTSRRTGRRGGIRRRAARRGGRGCGRRGSGRRGDACRRKPRRGSAGRALRGSAAGCPSSRPGR